MTRTNREVPCFARSPRVCFCAVAGTPPPAVDGTEPRTRTRACASVFFVLLPVWPVLGAGTCPVALDKGMKFIGALSAQAHTMLALPAAE